MAHLFARLVAAQDRWARPFGDFNHRWLTALFRPIRPLKDFLNGTWLGHPLHAVLTDAPIGIFTAVIVLDVLDLRIAADVTLVLGVLSMAAAALAGLADYSDTDGTPRTRATLHGTLMVVGLLVYLAYVLGNMINRHAWRGAGTKWLPIELPAGSDLAGDLLKLPESTPTKARLGINNLVLIRQCEAILALHDQFAHAGGPLSEGSIVDGGIECPWHGSRYGLGDG